MSEKVLAIEIEKPGRAFQPGETIRGRAKVGAPATWKAEYLELAIFWRTEGRGTEDTASVFQEKLHMESVLIPPDFEHRFSAPLPDMPWTYHGKLIKIHWAVGLYAKEVRNVEEFVEETFLLHPNLEILMPPE